MVICPTNLDHILLMVCLERQNASHCSMLDGGSQDPLEGQDPEILVGRISE